MAAGQQRKRLASSNLHELQGKKKKKRVDSSSYILNLRSHVHLQWDNVLKRVVAKREQVGITWKELSPYVDSVPKFHSGLADVFSFPKEIFDLDNLMEVLSHKVWLTCLSSSERKLLMQFLPSCVPAEQAVQALLTGENLHFGNLLFKWSTLLCSSNLHPDILLQKERQTKISKKQYNLEINNYHTNMVVGLRMLKEQSGTCEDPEKLWRKLSPLNDCGDRVGAEKPNDYSILNKEVPMKMCNPYLGVAKYMSYIKVNKKQFKMLKELKHSGGHIQSKSVSRVLGNVKNFQIFPYESYEDEENNKIREHWMQVTRDTLAAFGKYNQRKFLKIQQMKGLEKELAESRTLIHEKAEATVMGNSPTIQIKVDRQTEHHSIVKTDEEDSCSRSHSIAARNHALEHMPSLNRLRELDSSISDRETGTEYKLKPEKDAPAPSQSIDNKMDSSPMVKEPKSLSWISVNCKDSNCQKPSETDLITSSDLPLNQCQHFKTQPSPIIDRESEIIEQDAQQLLPSAFNAKTTSQMFSSYSQNHEEVIPTFPMASEMLSSHMNGLSQPGLQFLMNCRNFPETDRFSLLEDSQRHAKERHTCDKDPYMQNTIDTNFSAKIGYDNQLRYRPSSSSRRTLRSSVTDGSARQNWFSNEHLLYNDWSGIKSSVSGVQSGGADGSLLGILPELRDLPHRSLLDPSVPGARNYFGVSLADQCISPQLSGSTGLSSAPIPSLEMMWMNYSHQSSSLQESVNKPFMKHWH